MVREMQELKRLNEELTRRLNRNVNDSTLFKGTSLSREPLPSPQGSS